MGRSVRILTVSLLALAVSAAHAEPGIVSGMGTQECAKINARTQLGGGYAQNAVATAAFSWVQGYISAWNVVGIIESGRFADLTSLSADEQWAQIASFCQKHPDGFLFDAARDMLANGLKMGAVIPMTKAPVMSEDQDRAGQ